MNLTDIYASWRPFITDHVGNWPVHCRPDTSPDNLQ